MAASWATVSCPFSASSATLALKALSMAAEKYEEVYLKAYASVLEAQRGLEDYLRFYNGLRPHQALGYRTPAEVF